MQSPCLHCSAAFEITDEDQRFYKKMNVPSPTHCPACRMQRRLAFINIQNLYRRKETGSGKEIITPFSPDKDLNVVSLATWWSDAIDGKKFGRNFDFTRSFFEQFAELQRVAPRWDKALPNCENCDWCFNTADSKNCYFIRSSMACEDCYYSDRLDTVHHGLDSLLVRNSELCYEVIDAENCFEVFWSQRISNCQKIAFSFDCDHVQNCLYCVGLRHKKYHILNREVSSEEFDKAWQNFQTDASFRTEHFAEFQKLKKAFPHRAVTIIGSENCSGDEIFHSQNVEHSFFVRSSEDSKFLDFASNTKSSYDCSQPDFAELAYETSSTYKLYNARFCANAILQNCDYCETCWNIQDCFGCVGLKKAQYCIFNKQYSKEEYLTLLPQVIEHMRKTPSTRLARSHASPSLRAQPSESKTGSQQSCEWGEFFPIELSPFAYNETVAQTYFPCTKEEASRYNWNWKEPEKFDDTGITKKIPAGKLPQNIADIPDDILNWAIKCEESGRLFKIQQTELALYRKMNLPIPHFHPDIRHACRMKLRNPRQLWSRKCAKCAAAIRTTYPPDGPGIVYCDACYLAEVY